MLRSLIPGNVYIRRCMVSATPNSLRYIHGTKCVAAVDNNEQLTSLLTSKKQKQRKVYQRLKSLVRKELESNFKLQNKTKLKLMDNKYHLKIKYNPKLEGSFTDFGINKIQTSALLDQFKHITKPTASQRRLLAVLGSRLSCISRNNPGTGNSLALILYSLNFRRPDQDRITSLIVAPTTQLVKQYRDTYTHLLEHYPNDVNKMVQFIYRDESLDVEEEQEKKLMQNPHILVTTPQRLLDIISKHSEDPNFVKLDRLRFIAFDEADILLLPTDKRQKHDKPASILIEYLNKLRSTVVNNPPLQYCFISGVDFTTRLPDLIEDQKWCQDRPIVPIGSPVVGKDEVVPRLRIPNNVNIGSVISDNQDLYDVKFRDLPRSLQETKKLIKSDIAQEFDLNYKMYRNQEFLKNKKIKLPIELIESIPKYLTKTANGNKKILLIIPEGVSIPNFIQELETQGLYCKSLDDDVKNFFSQTSEQFFSPSNPQFLVSTVTSIAGITFTGLDRIICLGVDSVMDANSLIMVASRCRRCNSGLIDEDEMSSTFFSEKDKYRGINDEEKSNVVMLYHKSQFKLMERFALERTIWKSGLPHLEPMVDDYEQIDLRDYEKLFDIED